MGGRGDRSSYRTNLLTRRVLAPLLAAMLAAPQFVVPLVVPGQAAIAAPNPASAPDAIAGQTPGAGSAVQARGLRAARAPRAQLAVTTGLDPTGRLIVNVATDAAKVRVSYQVGARKRARTLAVTGTATTVLPRNASQVRARALARKGLRASALVAVSLTGTRRGAPVGLAGQPIGQVGQWAYSPDGTKVAFLSNDPNLVGTPSATGALLVADVATGAISAGSADPTGVIGNRAGQPALVLRWSWLPNGQLAFLTDSTNLVPGVVDGAAHAYVKDLATGAVALVSTPMPESYPLDGMPVWSADGTRMAFAWHSPCPGPLGVTLPRRGVFVVELASGLMTPVIAAPACGDLSAPTGEIWVDAISRTGMRVLIRRVQVKSYGQMAVHDLGASRVVAVASGPATFSPDGTDLLTVTQVYGDEFGQSSQVIVTDLEAVTSRVVVAATGSRKESLRAAAWAPDGVRIAFEFQSRLGRATLSGADSNRRADIYVRDINTGATSLVSQGRRAAKCRAATAPGWSPDGTRVGFVCSPGALLTVTAGPV